MESNGAIRNIGNDKILRKTRLPDPVNGIHSTEVEIACSTCNGAKVVIVPDIELPKTEKSAPEDVRCHDCEELVA
jgi:hypothetical protein